MTVENFDEFKKLSLLDIRNIVQMDEVPAQVIINWDQTGISYLPASNWTVEQVGSNQIQIIGKDGKQQLTAVFGCSHPSWYIKEKRTNAFLNINFLLGGISLLLRTIGAIKLLVGISLTSLYHIWTELKRN